MSEFMGKRSYDDLDKAGHLGNNVQDALSSLINHISAMYPDNSRTEPTVEEFTTDIEYFVWVAERYVTELRTLIPNSEQSMTDKYFGGIDL